jgi:hypothetical protein
VTPLGAESASQKRPRGSLIWGGLILVALGEAPGPGPRGVGYEHYTDFHRVERSVTRHRFDAHLVQDWLPLTPVWPPPGTGLRAKDWHPKHDNCVPERQLG